MPDVRVTQVRSAASRKADQGRTLRALGLTRIRSSVVHEDRPEILGMIDKVSHLVVVEPDNAELHRRAEHPKTRRGDGGRKRRSGSPRGKEEGQ
jgi:large subunit ribosomal protein L30